MHTYKQLNSFVKKVLNYALQENIEFEIYSYSPKNKYFIKINESELGWFSTQNKYIITFNKNSFKKLKHLLKKHNSAIKTGVDSLQKYNLYGYDIFQSVEAFTLSYHTAKSSKKYNLEEFEKQKERWIKAQNNFNQEDTQKLEETLKRAEEYLQTPGSKLSISRVSGISHKIRIIPNTIKNKLSYIEKPIQKAPEIIKTRITKSKLDHISYRPVVFLFGKSESLPRNHIKEIDKKIFEEPYIIQKELKILKPKIWKNSISGQYLNTPEKFNFYEKIGIFEIYNKK